MKIVYSSLDIQPEHSSLLMKDMTIRVILQDPLYIHLEFLRLLWYPIGSSYVSYGTPISSSYKDKKLQVLAQIAPDIANGINPQEKLRSNSFPALAQIGKHDLRKSEIAMF